MKICLALIAAILFFSCKDSQDYNIEIPEEPGIENYTEGVAPKLLTRIDDFINFSDSLFENNIVTDSALFTSDIIIVQFSKNRERCFVALYPSFYYDTRLTDGYILYRNKMIAFYKSMVIFEDSDKVCSSGLVNYNLLLKDENPKF